MEEEKEAEPKLNSKKLSRAAVCEGLFQIFRNGRDQTTAAGLAVARTALMDAAKLHGLMEKQASGQTETWGGFLRRIARGHVGGRGGEQAAE